MLELIGLCKKTASTRVQTLYGVFLRLLISGVTVPPSSVACFVMTFRRYLALSLAFILSFGSSWADDRTGTLSTPRLSGGRSPLLRRCGPAARAPEGAGGKPAFGLRRNSQEAG
jgi:hypothetical protein